MKMYLSLFVSFKAVICQFECEFLAVVIIVSSSRECVGMLECISDNDRRVESKKILLTAMEFFFYIKPQNLVMILVKILLG